MTSKLMGMYSSHVRKVYLKRWQHHIKPTTVHFFANGMT